MPCQPHPALLPLKECKETQAGWWQTQLVTAVWLEAQSLYLTTNLHSPGWLKEAGHFTMISTQPRKKQTKNENCKTKYYFGRILLIRKLPATSLRFVSAQQPKKRKRFMWRKEYMQTVSYSQVKYTGTVFLTCWCYTVRPSMSAWSRRIVFKSPTPLNRRQTKFFHTRSQSECWIVQLATAPGAQNSFFLARALKQSRI